MSPRPMTFSVEELLAIASNYWDSSKDFYLRQETSPRTERLQAVWARELANAERWWDFRDELQRALPDFTLKLMGSTSDAGFRFIAYPPRGAWAVVGCASILAPLYAVHGVRYEDVEGRRSHFQALLDTPLPGMALPAEVIARGAEEILGFSAIPPEIARTPVPLFVESKEPPHTTLFHALFTSAPSSIP